ncbi:histidine kinase [Hymenobacter nivis]|uniref:Histidine kinase n=1 Tax=Hymenobacter nivis TaxID=1850093 RepID=A0A502GXF0_9BACT|nr:histidine kinase [Hymenobacter nivis]TPG67097.1 histidine kinase [Hymenobacter nivis]
MAQLRQSQTESELRQLRAQIDSHFLFNNLNVLRGLIQHDPAEAHAYLNRFANLYRFLIRHKDDDFVTLAEELQFVYEYVYLLRHRFGAAYGFRQELPAAAELRRLLVVRCSRWSKTQLSTTPVTTTTRSLSPSGPPLGPLLWPTRAGPSTTRPWTRWARGWPTCASGTGC